MNVLTFLLSAGNPTHQVSAMEFADILDESVLVKFDFDFLRKSACLLFDCRVAFSGLEFSACALHLEGVFLIDGKLVDQLGPDEGTVPVIGSAYLEYLDGGSREIRLDGIVGTAIRLRSRSGTLVRANLDIPAVPPDVTETDADGVSDGFPQWTSDVVGSDFDVFKV